MSDKVREEGLREAACNGDRDRVQELLAAGVDANAQNAMNGWTALHWAAKRDREPCVVELLKARALVPSPRVGTIINITHQPNAQRPAQTQASRTRRERPRPILPGRRWRAKCCMVLSCLAAPEA